MSIMLDVYLANDPFCSIRFFERKRPFDYFCIEFKRISFTNRILIILYSEICVDTHIFIHD